MSAESATGTPGDFARPVLRVVRGEPTPEELAVLTAVVSASASAPVAPASQVPARGHWTDPRLLVRRQLYPGPGAWRAATWG